MNRRVFIGGAACAAAAEFGTVETQSGRVRGIAGDGLMVFRGIPYGEAPARFQAPEKPRPWTGVRDCTQTGARCIQGPGNIFLSPTIGEYFRGSKDRAELAAQPESEQCLVLNVLTPSTRGKRPVMVYIHGGGFTGGSSHITVYGDQFPREQDVVVVGVNHRLNVFGYLYLGGLHAKYAAGNVGQLDLVLALQWVRDNIAHFGGDPGNVTVFGESGGAAKISTLLAMPAAKGLFHKAILESGSVLRVGDPERATKMSKTLLTRLGLNESSVEKLETIPAADLFQASLPAGDSQFRYIPVVDGRTVPSQIWEPAAPSVSTRIPLLMGCCKHETSLFTLRDEELYKLSDAGLLDRIEKAGFVGTDARKLIAAYRGAHPRENASDIWFRFATDREARWNAMKMAELKVGQNAGSVHMYHFEWETPLVDGKIKAFHTAELPLALRLVRFPESESLSKQISASWAAFARKGDPGWARYDLEKRSTMIFDAPEGKTVADPDREVRLLLKDRKPAGPF